MQHTIKYVNKPQCIHKTLSAYLKHLIQFSLNKSMKYDSFILCTVESASFILYKGNSLKGVSQFLARVAI